MTTFTDGTTSGVSTQPVTAPSNVKLIKVTIPTTFVWGTDVLSIDLTKYGGRTLLGWWCFEETTAGSVVVPAFSTSTTTAVSSGTLTLTTTGASANTCGGSIVLMIA